MPAVVLILGLVAAGIYTENPWFYLAAGLGGGIHVLLLAAITATTSSIATEVKKNPSRFNIRNN